MLRARLFPVVLISALALTTAALPKVEAAEAAAGEAVQAAPEEEARVQAAGQVRAALQAGRPVREVRPRRAVALIPGQAPRVPIPA
jgi:hypothetical protein